jgi:uncharacterized protein YgiM (DUF1202 family)
MLLLGLAALLLAALLGMSAGSATAQTVGGPGADFMGGGPLAQVSLLHSLNLRRGPGVQYGVVSVLGGGTQVEMLYRWQSGFWVAVEIPDGRIGWLNATYLNADFATGALPEWTANPESLLGQGAPSPAPAAPTAPATKFGSGPRAFVALSFRLNMRQGPTVLYPVVQILEGGQEVEMVYRWREGLWVAVRLADGRMGWVNATYLNANFATGNLPEWVLDPVTVK